MSSADIEAIAKQARKSLKKGEIPQAIQLFQQALKVDEKRPDLHEGLATASFMAKDYDTAIKHFTRITQIDPRQGRAHINLGAVLNRVEKYNEAISALRRGISKQRCSEGFYNMGLAHRGLDQLALAVSAYREAIRIDPEMTEAHLNLANVYVEMGNHQQAMIHYRKTLEFDPESLRGKQGLEAALAKLSEAKSSISPFGRLVDENQMTAKSVATAERTLTDVERMEDRRIVSELAGDILATAAGFLDRLRRGLEPGLVALDRAATQTDETAASLIKSFEDYSAALQECSEFRRLLKVKLAKLKEHEDKMNA